MKKTKTKSSKKSHLSKLVPKVSVSSTSPSVIEYIWEEREDDVKINVFDYNGLWSKIKDLSTVSESLKYRKKPSISWINITGLQDECIIKNIWEHYNVHPLVLWDIVNTTQRPKFEDHEEYLYLTLKMIYYKEGVNDVFVEQISLIVWDGYLISLQEVGTDVFDNIRERITTNKGRICKMWSDYLMYAILDAIVDQYFVVMEDISEKIEAIEEQLMLSTEQELLHRIYELKQELIVLKKTIWPLREVINRILRNENDMIKESTLIYLRDVYDHTVQIIETVETFRDLTSWMLDLHLSNVSNKMNEIMKILTMFSAIFIPLWFLSGTYWMNFHNISAYSSEWGYTIWWLASITMTLILLWIFKKKKWF